MRKALPRLKEGDLEKASRLSTAKTGVGCDVFHPKVPLDLTKETSGEIVEFLDKVEQSGKWPQRARTTMSLLIPKNVTSETDCARANVDSLVGSFKSARSGEVAAEVSRGLGRHGWPKRRSSTNGVGHVDGSGKI